MIRLLLVALSCFVFGGCREQAKLLPEAAAPTVSHRAPVKLTLLVVDDPELAKGIKLLRGEWSERSGGELVIETVSLAELLAAERLSADVVIYPSRQLGTLVMREWLRPVRQSVLDSADLALSDLLPVVRDQTLRFGGEVWGVPLGEMPLVLAWRGKIPEKLPTTWEQLSQIYPRSGTKSAAGYPLTAAFIARVVATTPPVDRAALFFDPETMDARLNQPNMLQALEQIRGSNVGNAINSQLKVDVTLPPRGKQFEAQLSPLLAAEETYNTSLDRWEKSASEAAPVVCGFSGRLVSVTQASRNAASAFKLLPWLVGGNAGIQLSARSEATLWFRNSQVSQAGKWLPAANAAENAAWLTHGLSDRDAYLVPRLPGIDTYLATLEKSLAESPTAEGLARAEKAWNSITDSLGREPQRQAFRWHLGLQE